MSGPRPAAHAISRPCASTHVEDAPERARALGASKGPPPSSPLLAVVARECRGPERRAPGEREEQAGWTPDTSALRCCPLAELVAIGDAGGQEGGGGGAGGERREEGEGLEAAQGRCELRRRPCFLLGRRRRRGGGGRRGWARAGRRRRGPAGRVGRASGAGPE